MKTSCAAQCFENFLILILIESSLDSWILNLESWNLILESLLDSWFFGIIKITLEDIASKALLQNSSFLPEIEENLSLISCTRLLLSRNKNKAKFIYSPTQTTMKWGNFIHFAKIFYTKVSRIRQLTIDDDIWYHVSQVYLLSNEWGSHHHGCFLRNAYNNRNHS